MHHTDQALSAVQAMVHSMTKHPAVEMTNSYTKPAAKPAGAYRADCAPSRKDQRENGLYTRRPKGLPFPWDWADGTNWTDAPYPFE